MPPKIEETRTKTSRLNLLCPVPLLDALPGVAGLLDTDGKWCRLSHYWDRLMSRANRPELSRDVLLGKPLQMLLPDEKQRGALRKAFVSLAEGKLEQHTQTLQFGSGGRALHVEMILKPLALNGAFAGALVQILDVTAHHLNRLALLDRERKLRELQEKSESQTTEHTESMARRTLEHAREMAALHQEMEQMTLGQSGQLGQLKETFGAATRKREEQHAHRMQDAAALAARANTAFREHPREFGAALCRIFKEQAACRFVTLYQHRAAERVFELSDHCDAPEVFHKAAEHGILRLAEGEGTCGMAAEERAPVKFSRLLDIPEYAPWATWAREYEYNCLWAMPLMVNEEIRGVVQLYFSEEDVPLPTEQLQLLTLLAQVAAPLIAVQAEPEVQPAISGPAPVPVEDNDRWRVIVGDLAKQYGSLLSGMLGHSTLAAAELGEAHAAREDVRAIEKAARAGARLTRRLAALSASRERAPLMELGGYVQKYLAQHRLSKNGADNPTLPVAPCEVRADAAALDVILDGIVEYARRNLSPGAAPLWTLVREDQAAHLTLLFDVQSDPAQNGHGTDAMVEFLLSREAARALGGQLELNRVDGQTSVVLTLPMEDGMRAEG